MTPAIFVFHFLVVVSVVTGHVDDDLSLFISRHTTTIFTLLRIWGGRGTYFWFFWFFFLIFFTFDSFSHQQIHCKCVRASWAYLVVLVSSVFCLLITFATLDPLHLSLLSLDDTTICFVDVGRVIVAWGGGIPSKYPCVMVVIVVVCVSNQSN